MKLTSTLFFVLLFASTLQAFQNESNEVWPAWRGPTLNGHAAKSANPPIEWSEDKNVSWKIELPGLGNSTPNVWDDMLILTYTVPTGRKREAVVDQSGKLKPDEFHELYVAAYELKTGKVAWQTKVAEVVPNEKGHQTSSYASASTVTDGKRIYAFFGSLGLFALDMEGNQIWDQKFSEMRTAAGFGEGASPALQDNILVIPWDEEGQSFVAGIDTATGDEAWRTQRDTGSAWTTPLIVKDGDKHVVIVSGTATTRAQSNVFAGC